MTIELASLPLAFLAGVLGIMSPCVWPLVPVVMSSTATGGWFGSVGLALGLSAAFAIAGTLLTFVLLNLGLDPVLFRHIAAVLLIAVGLTLLVPPLAEWLTVKLSGLTSRVDTSTARGSGFAGQFLVGSLLGLVWLPCVGPTLGAAIALASMGQDMGLAFSVMFTFGLGTGSVLLIAGLASGALLSRLRPGILQGAGRGKQFLGGMLLVLGVMVLAGVDKLLESWALQLLPGWVLEI